MIAVMVLLAMVGFLCGLACGRCWGQKQQQRQQQRQQQQQQQWRTAVDRTPSGCNSEDGNDVCLGILGGLFCDELRAILRRRGKAVSGVKAELILRVMVALRQKQKAA